MGSTQQDEVVEVGVVNVDPVNNVVRLASFRGERAAGAGAAAVAGGESRSLVAGDTAASSAASPLDRQQWDDREGAGAAADFSGPDPEPGDDGAA